MIITGAKSISKMIKINHTLQVLDISLNAIGDEGIVAIARDLHDAVISELYVQFCEITVTGAKLLAEHLINNHTIKLLKLVDNNITVDGAIAVLEAAIANGICQEVKIDYEYKGDDKVKGMMATLDTKRRQKVGSIV